MTGPSLRNRALLAVGLTVFFYAMAIAIGVGLIAAPILLWIGSGSGNLWVTIAMVAAGVAVLRAIVPPRDRFEPPGPTLERETHPRLHALLDDVAREAGEPPTDAVFLDLEANASVLEHGRKRLMVLGLPLLATLDADELRAVIAHEYGHFVGGDTRFSRWIWRTRVAALKTVGALASAESWFQRNIVRWPFELYARAFLRITNAISRRAEFAADALAGRVASPEAAGRALRRINAVAPAWDMYWQSDVTPMLSSEQRPPVAHGFAEMTAHRELSAQLDELLATEVETREPDPYASHPTLRQRLEALGVEVEGQVPPPAEHPATELLADVREAEQSLLRYRFGEEVGAFPAVDWSAAATVHLDGMRRMTQNFPGVFDDLTLADAATAATNIPKRRLVVRNKLEPDEQQAPDEAVDALVVQLLGACATVAAVEAGCTLTAVPGEPLRLVVGEAKLEPFNLLGQITVGEASPDAWRQHPVVAHAARASLATRAPESAGAV